MTLASAVLAHEGGWDEILYVLVPIGMFAGLLAIANRRATRAADQVGAEVGGEVGGEADDPRSDD